MTTKLKLKIECSNLDASLSVKNYAGSNTYAPICEAREKYS